MFYTPIRRHGHNGNASPTKFKKKFVSTVGVSSASVTIQSRSLGEYGVLIDDAFQTFCLSKNEFIISAV